MALPFPLLILRMIFKVCQDGWRTMKTARNRQNNRIKCTPGSTHKRGNTHRQSTPKREKHKKTPKEHQDTGRWVIHYTNVARQKHAKNNPGKRGHKLTRNLRLQSAAQRQSDWMVKHDQFSHDGRGGSEPLNRAAPAGYNGQYVGENIFKHPVDRDRKKLGKKLVDGWMKSPGHRENILNDRFIHIGVGVAERKGYVFVTQKFGGYNIG